MCAVHKFCGGGGVQSILRSDFGCTALGGVRGFGFTCLGFILVLSCSCILCSVLHEGRAVQQYTVSGASVSWEEIVEEEPCLCCCCRTEAKASGVSPSAPYSAARVTSNLSLSVFLSAFGSMYSTTQYDHLVKLLVIGDSGE